MKLGKLHRNGTERFLAVKCMQMLPLAPNSCLELSTCIGTSIVITSRSKITSCHLGQLSGDNCCTKLAELNQWDEQEDAYASQFCMGFGTPVTLLYGIGCIDH